MVRKLLVPSAAELIENLTSRGAQHQGEEDSDKPGLTRAEAGGMDWTLTVGFTEAKGQTRYSPGTTASCNTM